jgi:hypothetical protein
MIPQFSADSVACIGSIYDQAMAKIIENVNQAEQYEEKYAADSKDKVAERFKPMEMPECRF